MDKGQQGQGSGGFGSGQMGKGLSSFLSDPQKVDAIVREGYIQTAGITGSDLQSVRNGDWDNRIEGFELTKHVLQHAEDLATKVPQTA